MIQLKRANSKKRRGAALVEAAIVLPILFVIILGIIEFGRGMMVAQMVVTAARTGVRSAVIDGATNADVTTQVQTFLADATGATATDIDVDITITPGPESITTGNEVANSEAGDMIALQVSLPFDQVSWLNGVFLKGTNLKGSAVMRHE